MSEHKELLKELAEGGAKALARAITIVENELPGYENILTGAKINRNIPVIGFTGPPGAGKSTLINALLTFLSGKKKRVGVIAIDPTSPFNYGSLLGDRLRMSEHFGNENIFIRSLASRGSLGGLSAKTIEVADVMRMVPFDYIFIETVGVGQSEIEIAGLADTTVLVLAPGFGDEVQSIKSGIMEIADVFAVNKSDTSGTEGLFATLKNLTEPRRSETDLGTDKPKPDWIPPVIKVISTRNEGIDFLMKKIDAHKGHTSPERKAMLYAEKVLKLVSKERLKDLDRKELFELLKSEMKKEDFNLYRFASRYY